MFSLYNIWERNGNESSQSWSSGMLISDDGKIRRYRCNDIGFDGGFDALVFRIERIQEARSSS